MDQSFIGGEKMLQSFPGTGAGKHNAASSRWKRFFGCFQVVMLFMCSTALASSPVFYVNKEHAICKEFVSLLQSAAVASMTDDQLCTFRFASLPESATGRFRFPKWREVDLADPEAEAMRVYEANAVRDQKRDSREIANYTKILQTAYGEDNLKVYRGKLKLEGSHDPLYLEVIDLNRCAKTKAQYQNTDGSITFMPYVYQGFPSIGAFVEPSYVKEIAAESSVFEAQVAVYDGKTPVQISIAPQWIRIRPQAVLSASLDVFRRMPATDTPYGWVPETLAAHSVCELELKPSVAKADAKVDP